jgi:thiamine-monophosphate kinase
MNPTPRSCPRISNGVFSRLGSAPTCLACIVVAGPGSGCRLPDAEKLLIAGIRGRAASRSRAIAAGIGDDCAILQVHADDQTLVTTDFSLEGVHFRREWHPAEVVGHRCLTRGLSDIAAMGGNPIAAFLSLALPQRLPQSWINQFLKGFLKLADRFHVTLAGGDTAQSPGGILADIVVIGSVPKGKAIRRSGARPGDQIYVTGALGGAAATLKLLFAGRKLRSVDLPIHFHPTPRIEIGRFLLEKGLAAAMIDLSDGLSTDLGHICEESGVGAEIQASAIPRASLGKPSRTVELEFALNGGDDYELLFTAPPEKRVPSKIAGIPITRIGRITREKPILLVNANGVASKLKPRGWEHFKEARS